MGWAVGYDEHWQRWVGYGVPATCDHPGCGAAIDRGLGCVCGGEPFGGEHGCGLCFCEQHLIYTDKSIVCERCEQGRAPFEATPDTVEWAEHVLTDESWEQWRQEEPEQVARMRRALAR